MRVKLKLNEADWWKRDWEEGGVSGYFLFQNFYIVFYSLYTKGC